MGGKSISWRATLSPRHRRHGSKSCARWPATRSAGRYGTLARDRSRVARFKSQGLVSPSPDRRPYPVRRRSKKGRAARIMPESALDAVDGSSTGTSVPWKWRLFRLHDSEEQAMQTITTIGLDIAKSVFQVHGVDAAGQGGHPPPVEAAVCAGVLSEAASMPGWHRGLRLASPLVARTSGARPLLIRH